VIFPDTLESEYDNPQQPAAEVRHTTDVPTAFRSRQDQLSMSYWGVVLSRFANDIMAISLRQASYWPSGILCIISRKIFPEAADSWNHRSPIIADF